MKLLKIIVSFFIGLFLFTACNVKKELVKTQQKDVVKSETNIVSYKDTTLFVPGSKVNLIIPKTSFKGCLNDVKDSLNKPTVYKKKFGNAVLTVKDIGGQYMADCVCDTIAIQAKLKNTLIKNKASHIEQLSVDNKRTKGVPVLTLIIYVIASLSIGFVGGYLSKIFKII